MPTYDDALRLFHEWTEGDSLRRHGYAEYSDTPRKSLLSLTLFAVDELAGFIAAVAYVRPTKLEGIRRQAERLGLTADG